jgi:hypothetical protein
LLRIAGKALAFALLGFYLSAVVVVAISFEDVEDYLLHGTEGFFLGEFGTAGGIIFGSLGGPTRFFLLYFKHQ